MRSFPHYRVGILGGGQLGKMLAIAGAPWHLPISILDSSDNVPAAPYATHFVKGNYQNYDDVLAFGQDLDVLTVEIEHVNTQALKALQKLGKTVHPDPRTLELINDKGKQKEFYKAQDLPTAPFQLFKDEQAIEYALKSKSLQYPFVQKQRTAGYDGKGVAVIKSERDKLLTGACLIENKVHIDKEIAVVVAGNRQGDIVMYPPVEMHFDDKANLLDMLISPARISPTLAHEAQQLAKRCYQAFGIRGLLAVEMFVDSSGQLLINEVAPRPHNSGHQTIEGCVTSQFEQHLRAILNLPLGSVRTLQPTVMVNLLGEEGSNGTPHYHDAVRCMNIEGLKMHLYGKEKTRAYRKMGHVTIGGEDIETIIEQAKMVKQRIHVTTTS